MSRLQQSIISSQLQAGKEALLICVIRHTAWMVSWRRHHPRRPTSCAARHRRLTLEGYCSVITSAFVPHMESCSCPMAIRVQPAPRAAEAKTESGAHMIENEADFVDGAKLLRPLRHLPARPAAALRQPRYTEAMQTDSAWRQFTLSSTIVYGPSFLCSSHHVPVCPALRRGCRDMCRHIAPPMLHTVIMLAIQHQPISQSASTSLGETGQTASNARIQLSARKSWLEPRSALGVIKATLP